ncbi:hypothetical protein EZV77_01695 [Burkholderia thailandensis]|nr:hypothetical protein [Burkholderia thailandensis]MDD1487541.1 hypothetical protein [Burkholderia thailandensis]MDD1493184.1 hypothetical protein [Burkholderia thailandensis]MDW9241248.1 acetylornithine deacetylase domain protein [Burkholderia thailandensis]PJO71432.1 hypothetical protein CWD92_16000 [Burkholderia thailandensis]
MRIASPKRDRAFSSVIAPRWMRAAAHAGHRRHRHDSTVQARNPTQRPGAATVRSRPRTAHCETSRTPAHPTASAPRTQSAQASAPRAATMAARARMRTLPMLRRKASREDGPPRF